MMVEAIFTEEMTEVLRGLKGKVLKSYECLMEAHGRSGSTYGNLRINLGRSSVDLNCEFQAVDDYFGEPEELTIFTCKPVNRDEPFVPHVVGLAKAYMVNERISRVALVRDHVDYGNGDCVIEMDIALLIRTKYHTFAFSRESWFDEAIMISATSPEKEPARIPSTRELWLDSSDLSVEVSREVIEL